MSTDMTKKRIRLSDRQCRIFLRDVREFGYPSETFESIRRIADQLAEGTGSGRDVVAIMMARQIDEAEHEASRVGRKLREDRS